MLFSFSAEIQTPQTSKMDSTQNFGLDCELYGHFMMCVSKGSREYMTSDLVGGRPPTEMRSTRDTLARDSGEGCSGEERWVLNRLGGMAIVMVRSRRKEHGRTDGSSVLYTLQDTYCVRSTRCWFVETMRVSAPEHYWRAVEKDDTAANPC
mmetsp:Transcript_24059/g.47799  ORF Transcript_24059/g.47799 Transcript_24059/m.47799 type:complete len:151 (-) Transcript_24059:646-1098(-)